jgi:hypothetical protein
MRHLARLPMERIRGKVIGKIASESSQNVSIRVTSSLFNYNVDNREEGKFKQKN